MSQMPIVTDDQMREIERRLIEQYGMTLLDKCERIGRALAEAARLLLDGSVEGKSIVIAAGPGETGAGGLAAARYLHNWNAEIRVVLSAPPDTLHEMARHQYSLLEEIGLEAWGLSLSQEEMAEQAPIDWTTTHLIIDALLGPEVSTNPGGDMADLIRVVNASRRPVLALGQPSGLAGDDGTIYSPCIDATATLAIALPKRALLEGWPVVGELWLANLEIPSALYNEMALPVDDPFHGRLVMKLGSARRLSR